MYYVVFFTTRYASLDEVFSKAPELISAHLARSNEFHARGALLMAGAFRNKPEEPLGTMGIFTTRDAAEEFARGDPFLLNGMVSDWRIREWTDLFARPTGSASAINT
jgi:uncharacterized protein YciI